MFFNGVFLCGWHTLIAYSQQQIKFWIHGACDCDVPLLYQKCVPGRMAYYFHKQLKVEELHYKNSTACIQAKQLKY